MTKAEHFWVYDFRDAVWSSDLPSNERLVLLAMSLRCDFRTGKGCRPGMSLLRALTGLSERTITRVRQECVKAGWLELEMMGSRKGRERASVYSLKIPTTATVSRVELSTPATEAGVTPDSESGVRTATPANRATTPANSAPDPCHVGDPSLLTTCDHRAGTIPSHLKVVASDHIGSIRNGRAS